MFPGRPQTGRGCKPFPTELEPPEVDRALATLVAGTDIDGPATHRPSAVVSPTRPTTAPVRAGNSEGSRRTQPSTASPQPGRSPSQRAFRPQLIAASQADGLGSALQADQRRLMTPNNVADAVTVTVAFAGTRPGRPARGSSRPKPLPPAACPQRTIAPVQEQ